MAVPCMPLLSTPQQPESWLPVTANENFKGTKHFSELWRSKGAFSRPITGAPKESKEGSGGEVFLDLTKKKKF